MVLASLCALCGLCTATRTDHTTCCLFALQTHDTGSQEAGIATNFRMGGAKVLTRWAVSSGPTGIACSATGGRGEPVVVWAACAPPRHPQKTPSRGVRRDHGRAEAAAEPHQTPHRLHQRHSHAPRPVAHVNPITPPHAPSQPPSQMPMHSPTTAPTKLAGPTPAAIKPHQTPQQLQAARGHVLRAAGV